MNERMIEIKVMEETKTIKITEFVKVDGEMKQFFIVLDKNTVWPFFRELAELAKKFIHW